LKKEITLNNISLRSWVIERLSNEVHGEKLTGLLNTLWLVQTFLMKLLEEKIAYVKMRAKATGLSITAVATACKRKNCYCRGMSLHYPYVRIYKDGKWVEVKKDEIAQFLSHYLDEADVTDFLAIRFLRNRVLRVYSNLGRILVCLGVVE
jgi:hypothetical protein